MPVDHERDGQADDLTLLWNGLIVAGDAAESDAMQEDDVSEKAERGVDQPTRCTPFVQGEYPVPAPGVTSTEIDQADRALWAAAASQALTDLARKSGVWNRTDLGTLADIGGIRFLHAWTVRRTLVTETRRVVDAFLPSRNERLPRQTVLTGDDVDLAAFEFFVDSDPDTGHDATDVPGSAREVKCHECSRGRIECRTCEGAGRTTCSRCDGEGRVACSTCYFGFMGGLAGITSGLDTDLHRQILGVGGNRGTGAVQGARGMKKCPECRGSGQRPCTSCSRGKVNCPNCGGKKAVDCKTCAGTTKVIQVLRVEAVRQRQQVNEVHYAPELGPLIAELGRSPAGGFRTALRIGPTVSEDGLTILKRVWADRVFSILAGAGRLPAYKHGEVEGTTVLTQFDPNDDQAQPAVHGFQSWGRFAGISKAMPREYNGTPLMRLVESVSGPQQPNNNEVVVIRDSYFAIHRTWLYVNFTVDGAEYRLFFGQGAFAPQGSPLADEPSRLIRSVVEPAIRAGDTAGAVDGLSRALANPIIYWPDAGELDSLINDIPRSKVPYRDKLKLLDCIAGAVETRLRLEPLFDASRETETGRLAKAVRAKVVESRGRLMSALALAGVVVVGLVVWGVVAGSGKTESEGVAREATTDTAVEVAAGKAATVPSAAPALQAGAEACGSGTAKVSARTLEKWSDWRCMSKADAAGRWSKCILAAKYTDDPAKQCPGFERCCPP